ncbi:hypothetical protein VNO77_40297 [Canavalia gladiata]|uniref:Uncharacterized protein n=1 Tax=Canavalia gladiata TaxID=3824 RepID=A0AAN9JXS7_CANGL
MQMQFFITIGRLYFFQSPVVLYETTREQNRNHDVRQIEYTCLILLLQCSCHLLRFLPVKDLLGSRVL